LNTQVAITAEENIAALFALGEHGCRESNGAPLFALNIFPEAHA
jgi:hypothetical protein